MGLVVRANLFWFSLQDLKSHRQSSSELSSRSLKGETSSHSKSARTEGHMLVVKPAQVTLEQHGVSCVVPLTRNCSQEIH